MARTSNVVWTVLAVLLLLFALTAALLGPHLYREGKALVGPIAELARSEKAMTSLNQEFPFEPPDGGIVGEERLCVFLAVWDELRRAYAEWQARIDDLEGRRTQSWQEAKEALAATRDVHRTQREALRRHRMSPAELIWIENAVLAWWRQVELQLADEDRPAVVGTLRAAREEDLRMTARLERQHGSSPALEAMERYLEDRLASLDASARPKVTDVPEENQELFWSHHEEIASIDEATHNPLHEMIRERGRLSLQIEDDGRPAPGSSRAN